jgi:arylsulfatase A-like enzyme
MTLLLLAVLAAQDRPNVVVILADDLGATDLACTGSRFHETPSLDRLAASGMRFTRAYSACTVCSPTRAALLTGRYPARLRVTDWIAGHKRPFAKLRVPDWTMRLPAEAETLAERFKAAGYATASLGKWHLGGADSRPEDHGFDLNVAGTDKGQPGSYFSPFKIPGLPDGPRGEHVTDRLADETDRFLEAHRDRPFFLYLPHFAVHTPIQGKPDLVEKYKAKADPAAPQKNPGYAALLEGLDGAVGRLVAKLEALKLREKTIVVFASDNGGLLPITSNLGLRAGKGSAYEGGVRVPLFVSWPGKIAPETRSDVPTITPDLYPTLLELAGLPAPSVDGASLAPVLLGKGAVPARPLYWHYPHYHPGGATPYSAVLDGGWRLIQFFEDGRLELYDLASDPREERNLAAEQPDRAKGLLAKLDDWRTSVSAQLPTPNPDHDPARK